LSGGALGGDDLNGSVEWLPNILRGFVKKVKDNAESSESHSAVIDGFVGIHFDDLLVCCLKVVLHNLRPKAVSNENDFIKMIWSRKESRDLTGYDALAWGTYDGDEGKVPLQGKATK
jgi:hypothetical protein